MSAANVQAIIGNPANFELLVMQLLSADNTSRKQAEVVYEALKQHPDACLELLLRCLRQSEKVENRSFCAIMLRKVGLVQPTAGSKQARYGPHLSHLCRP